MYSKQSMLFLVLLSASTFIGCTSVPPEPIFIGGDDGGSSGDGDSDGDIDINDETEACTGESFPCGPYGHEACEVIENLSFVPVNSFGEDVAGGEGELLELSDIYADESINGLLLFGTAGWCPFCGNENTWLNQVHREYREKGIEFVAVIFERGMGEPATVDYAKTYAERVGYPAVADTRGDLLYYFDGESAPGNIFIDTTEMRIYRIVQGFDQATIELYFNILDGSVNCQ